MRKKKEKRSFFASISLPDIETASPGRMVNKVKYKSSNHVFISCPVPIRRSKNGEEEKRKEVPYSFYKKILLSDGILVHKFNPKFRHSVVQRCIADGQIFCKLVKKSLEKELPIDVKISQTGKSIQGIFWR
jgi:hypothetical protein